MSEPAATARAADSTVAATTVAATTGRGRTAADAGSPVPDLNPGQAQRLRAAGLDPGAVRSFVAAALAEDLAGGIDVTTAATVPRAAHGRANLVAREIGRAHV